MLSPLAFARLLTWLDDGCDSDGATYLEMRRRLVAYFDRRDCPQADDLADETLNRVARTLETDGAIATSPPARYCYVVARFVLLEDRRHEQASGRAAHAWGRHRLGRRDNMPADATEEMALREHRFECLDQCLDSLKPDQRHLAIEYYRDARREKITRRRGLAERLGVTMNALAIRASRIRAALEACVTECCQGR